MTLREVPEDELLAGIFPLLPGGEQVIVGPGDDTALMGTGGDVLATTDTMVRGEDWRDDWSEPEDVGAKAVVQNAADIAAMGGVTTGILVTLVADPDTSRDWVERFSRGLGDKARELGIAVLGGDLSSAGPGTLMVSVTALGSLQGRRPVLRSGARPGDVLAVSGPLGRAAAGLELLMTDWVPRGGGVSGVGTEDLVLGMVTAQRRPSPDLRAGVVAAEAGAHAMIDVSDGLARDAGRIARSSGAKVVLDAGAVARFAAVIVPALGAESAYRCVVEGGEEHVMLAAFAAEDVPDGWTAVGHLEEGEGCWLDGDDVSAMGWDHFGGRRRFLVDGTVLRAADHLDSEGNVIDPDPVPVRS